MKQPKPEDEILAQVDIPAVPLTLEGLAVLHQMFRIARPRWRALGAAGQQRVVSEAVALADQMARRDDGESAFFSQLGHKGDLLVLHFRRTFDELNGAELAIAGLELSDYLEPVTSYLSVIELGVYEASVTLYMDLIAKGLKPHTAEWHAGVEAELARQRTKLAARLYPKIPPNRYLCFYPMAKTREGGDNWYRMPIEQRRDLMREHGMVGRRYGGQVTQIISGSIGFDDWEWGVDLFAEDPLVFKKLIYEMRFDEVSAVYALFGSFYVGLRVPAAGLGGVL